MSKEEMMQKELSYWVGRADWTEQEIKHYGMTYTKQQLETRQLRVVALREMITCIETHLLTPSTTQP